jgi:hypothetical protein
MSLPFSKGSIRNHFSRRPTNSDPIILTYYLTPGSPGIHCSTKIIARHSAVQWHYQLMPKRSSTTTHKRKNPAAVALGRLGGLKGGPARIAKLSAKGRSELAHKAVLARWSKAKKRGPS